jgi:hypothetical protein
MLLHFTVVLYKHNVSKMTPLIYFSRRHSRCLTAYDPLPPIPSHSQAAGLQVHRLLLNRLNARTLEGVEGGVGCAGRGWAPLFSTLPPSLPAFVVIKIEVENSISMHAVTSLISEARQNVTGPPCNMPTLIYTEFDQGGQAKSPPPPPPSRVLACSGLEWYDGILLDKSRFCLGGGGGLHSNR